MKNKLLILAFIFTGLNVGAQVLNVPDKLQLQEKKMLLQNVERNGLTLILDGEEQSIRKQFNSYLKDTYKWSLKSKSKLLVGEDLYTTVISDKHFSIQVMVQQTGEGNELRYFMSFGKDVYVNSADYPNESKRCEEILRNFAKVYYSSYVKEQIELKEKEIETDNKVLEGIKKDIGSNLKSNSKAEIKIEKLKKRQLKTEEKIRKLTANVEKGQTEVESTEATVKTLNDKKTELDTAKRESETKIATKKSAIAAFENQLNKINNY